MNWYKIRVDFVEETEHECNCEYCDRSVTNKENGFEISSFVSINEEGAKQQAVDEIKDEYSNAKNIMVEILETREVPKDKFLFEGLERIIHLDNGWLADGFVALDQQYCVSFSDNVQNLAYPSEFKSMEPVQKLEDYQIETDGGNYAQYPEGRFNLAWVNRLNDLGIYVYSVKNGNAQSPFALCKDGEMVGIIMPVHKLR